METFDLAKWNGFTAPSEGMCKNSLIDQIVIDSRRISSPNALFVALKGNHTDGHAFIGDAAKAGAKFALVDKDYRERGEKIVLLRVSRPLGALQEIAAVYRKELNIPILAICGSYGKTMTKDLLTALLQRKYLVRSSPESFNSQIGVPLSLFTLTCKDELGIIETAISKPKEMQRLASIIQPQYAILTTIAKRYLHTLKSLRESKQEHLKLVEALPQKGWALLPKICINHLAACPIYSEDEKGGGLPFAIAKGASYEIHFVDHPPFVGNLLFEHPSLIPLMNRCVKAASLLGLSSEQIVSGLSFYSPEPRHAETWTTPSGITIVNDVYAEDPLSIRKALKTLPSLRKEGKKVFVFGGFRQKAKLSYAENQFLLLEVKKAKIDQLVVVGLAGETLKSAAKKAHANIQVSHFLSHEEALAHLRCSLQHGDVLLLKGEKKRPIEEIAKEISDGPCENRLLINLSAIRSNLALIQAKLTKKTRVMVMVKARGYGTDHVMLGNFLSKCGIAILGVAHVDEAIALREGGLEQSIFVVNIPTFEATKLVKYGFEVGISDDKLMRAVEKEAAGKNKVISCHLHIDTGMNRFGCRKEEAVGLAKTIDASPHLNLVGVMTHLAAADLPSEDPFTRTQIKHFKKCIDALYLNNIKPKWIHAANSSGTLRFDFPFCNMVRLGLAPFGLFSCEEEKEVLPLKTALSLHSRIAGINVCKQGETISYGRTYAVEKKQQKIGIVPLGYYDGLHRHYSEKGYVMIRGKKAPMVGKICMDFMMVDVTNIPEVAEGDPVLIFGEDYSGNTLSPEEFASWGKTDVRELITCLGPRIQRLFIDDEN